MQNFEVKHRHTGAILYAGGGETLRDVVVAAVRSGANLYGADLSSDFADRGARGDLDARRACVGGGVMRPEPAWMYHARRIVTDPELRKEIALLLLLGVGHGVLLFAHLLRS